MLQIDNLTHQISNIILSFPSCSCSRIDHSVSERIFLSVNATLEKSEYKLSSGRIITGQEEAVSGWTIVNYLGNRLQKPVSSLKSCM